MENSLFIVTAGGFAALTMLCIGFIIRAAHVAGRQHLFVSPKLKWSVLAALTLWLAILSGLSLSGFYADFSGLPPRLPLLGPLPPILLIGYLVFAGKADKLLTAIPPAWIMALQSFRLPVEILLWMLFAQNLLPERMTFEGRNWDILVGLTAIPVAYGCFGGSRFRFRLAVVWNICGLLLLANIVTIAVLSMPTPFMVFQDGPTNEIVARFPFVFLPGFLVPLAFSLHVLSLRQIFVLRKNSVVTPLQREISLL